MPADRSELKRAVHSMLNDVVEQCFQQMIHYPQQAQDLNRIIKDATEEINYQVLKIDAHDHKPNSAELDVLYRAISKDTHKKSLRLLGQLQSLQKTQRSA